MLQEGESAYDPGIRSGRPLVFGSHRDPWSHYVELWRYARHHQGFWGAAELTSVGQLEPQREEDGATFRHWLRWLLVEQPRRRSARNKRHVNWTAMDEHDIGFHTQRCVLSVHVSMGVRLPGWGACGARPPRLPLLHACCQSCQCCCAAEAKGRAGATQRTKPTKRADGMQVH